MYFQMILYPLDAHFVSRNLSVLEHVLPLPQFLGMLVKQSVFSIYRKSDSTSIKVLDEKVSDFSKTRLVMLHASSGSLHSLLQARHLNLFS